MKSFKSYLSEAGKLDATKFEGDLEKAFNSISAKGTEGRERAPGERFQSETARKLAQQCVKSLMTKVKGEPRVAFRTAGGGGASVLTAAYTSGGPGKSVKSGEPKTDVVFITTTGERYRCSVKAGAGAQIASAQTGEMWAVMNAVFTGPRGGPIAQIITKIITETGNSKVYYANRKKFEKRYGEDSFDALLSKVTGLKSGAGQPTQAELNQMNEFLGVLGINERLTPEISEYMNKPENRKALLREFATGEMRFTKLDFIASHFLKWYENGTVKLYDVDTFLKETLPRFKFALRDRGSKRGMALRVDDTGKGKPPKGKPVKETVNLCGNPLDEERYLEIRDQLNEGLSDWYASAKTAIGRGWELLVSAVRKVVDFFAKMLTAGLDKILDFLGVEPEVMEYTW